MKNLLWAVCVVALLAARGAAGADDAPGRLGIPAFEIHGFGKDTVGGRHGEVYRVTKRQGAGRGTIYDAISKPNRYIVFDVGGEFVLPRNVDIRQHHLTIDGSTAPGGGVQFTGGHEWNILADEVILRHVRLRPGMIPDRKPTSKDCLTVGRGINIVIDHVSCSWATDEGISSWGRDAPIRNLTIQWSIVSEALLCPEANRPKCVEQGGPSAGGLFEGDLSGFTFYRNLYAHNVNRNPQILYGPLYDRHRVPPGIIETSGLTRVQLQQNVVFHYLYGMRLSAESRNGVIQADILDNTFKWGPAWELSGRPMRRGFTTGPKVAVERLPPGRRAHNGRLDLFLSGNVSPRRRAGDPECNVFQTGSNEPCDLKSASAHRELVRRQPFTPALPRVPADQAFTTVVNGAGATLPCRDAVDARIARETTLGTGRWIDEPAEVGGWANLDVGCDHVNQAPVAMAVRANGSAGARIAWKPVATDPDRAPLTGLTCSIVGATAARARVEPDCSGGSFDATGLASGERAFDYEVSDGEATARARVTVSVR